MASTITEPTVPKAAPEEVPSTLGNKRKIRDSPGNKTAPVTRKRPRTDPPGPIQLPEDGGPGDFNSRIDSSATDRTASMSPVSPSARKSYHLRSRGSLDGEGLTKAQTKGLVTADTLPLLPVAKPVQNEDTQQQSKEEAEKDREQADEKRNEEDEPASPVKQLASPKKDEKEAGDGPKEDEEAGEGPRRSQRRRGSITTPQDLRRNKARIEKSKSAPAGKADPDASNDFEEVPETPETTLPVGYSGHDLPLIPGGFEEILSPVTYSNGATGEGKGFSIIGQKDVNQDRLRIVHVPGDATTDAMTLFQVYDGHGILGHVAAHQCIRQVWKDFKLEYQKKSPKRGESIDTDDADKSMRTCLSDALLSTHGEIVSVANGIFESSKQGRGRLSSPRRPIQYDYGTTAVLGVCDGRKVIVGWVGDSTCIHVKAKQDASGKWETEVETLTKLHVAKDNPDEIVRVKREGGKVSDTPGDMRLYPGDRAFMVARQQGLAVNMTRAIGHRILSNYGLSPLPDFRVVPLEPGYLHYFVMGSDGVFDMVPDEEAGQAVVKLLEESEGTAIEQDICVDLIELAEERWADLAYGDNITCLAFRASLLED